MSAAKIYDDVMNALTLIESEMPPIQNAGEGVGLIIEGTIHLVQSVSAKQEYESAKAVTGIAALCIRYLKDLYVQT